jgi:NAD(P)-dependent dehydrogenase (short-subunit alcohol dehydrogenase family)
MESAFNLKGKVAIVTGGGKGIGREIALGLARSGARVVVSARTQSEIEAVEKEIKDGGQEAMAIVTDITENEQIENMVNTVWRTYGRIDILVNNAARSFLRSLLDLREDGWDKIFNTNCKGTFLLSRAAARIMKEQGGGSIVNITTVGAVRGGIGMGAYHASKAALKMLTMCMASEWAPFNINVNAVGPGLTKTHFSQPIWSNPEVENQIAGRIPKGRLAEPNEIVGAVLFLCSDAANFITGQSIYVDGGTLAAT